MSTARYFIYSVPCKIHGNVTEILKENEPAPTTCRRGSTDEIDEDNIEILDIISENIVSIKEETTPTNGYFQALTRVVIAPPNQTSIHYFPTDIPISALSLDFVSGDQHRGDEIAGAAVYERYIGIILANIMPVTQVWQAKNYTKGQIVTHTDVVYGDRVYTCIKNTVNAEKPPNWTYWQNGYPLVVPPQTIAPLCEGFVITLTDGINKQDMGVVIAKNNATNTVYVKKSPQYNFQMLQTKVLVSVYTVYEYTIGEPWQHEIGQSKIGGSFLDKDSVITVIYNNKHPTDTKTLVVRLEKLQ